MNILVQLGNGDNLYIAVTEIEAKAQSDCVTDDIGRESVAFVCVHERILPFSIS